MRYYYHAFGVVTESEGTAYGSITYAGYQYDGETGLYYRNARYYDPVTARFLQEDDPSYSNVNYTLSLNLYTYVSNNPLIYSDPTGHFQDYQMTAADRKRVKTLGSAYNIAKAKGDTAGMDNAHRAAAVIRNSYDRGYVDGYYYHTTAPMASTAFSQPSKGAYGKGSKGSMVGKIQTALLEKGYSVGRYGVDKSFGKDTQLAVLRYQVDHGLRADGYVDANMKRSLGISVTGGTSATPDISIKKSTNVVNTKSESGTQGTGKNTQSTSTSTFNKGVYGDGLYGNVTGPNLKRGLTLGEVEAGIAKVGGEYEYGNWQVGTVTADVKAGVSLDYVGVQAGARLVEGEFGVKIPWPFTDKSLYLGVGGELFAIGYKGYYDRNEKKLKFGAAALIGASISIGLED